MAKDTIINPRTITILLVEDSESDIRLIKEFLKEIDVNNVLHVVKDGIQAISYLRKHCNHSDHCPHIVILDLNLPRMSGHEVLKEMKEDEDLKRIPVIILTTSTAQEDIHVCYDSHASCYITKPAEFEDFERVMKIIKDFWINTAKLPP